MRRQVGTAEQTGGSLGHVYTRALRGFSIQLPPGLARQALEGETGVLKVEADVPTHAVAQTPPTGVKRIAADQNALAHVANGVYAIRQALIDGGKDQATVTGSTDDSGLELLVTKALSGSGTMTSTVTKILDAQGRECELQGTRSDSYTKPRYAGRRAEAGFLVGGRWPAA